MEEEREKTDFSSRRNGAPGEGIRVGRERYIWGSLSFQVLQTGNPPARRPIQGLVLWDLPFGSSLSQKRIGLLYLPVGTRPRNRWSGHTGWIQGRESQGWRQSRRRMHGGILQKM